MWQKYRSIRGFFRRKPIHTSARAEFAPYRDEGEVDPDNNVVIPLKGLKESALKRRFHRAMIAGWKSLAPYS